MYFGMGSASPEGSRRQISYPDSTGWAAARSCRLMALFEPHTTSVLSPQCVPKRKSASAYRFISFRPRRSQYPSRALPVDQHEEFPGIHFRHNLEGRRLSILNGSSHHAAPRLLLLFLEPTFLRSSTRSGVSHVIT